MLQPKKILATSVLYFKKTSQSNEVTLESTYKTQFCLVNNQSET